MTLTYFDTLYNKKTTTQNIDNIEFSDDGIHFSFLGFKCCVQYHNAISVTENDYEDATKALQTIEKVISKIK